MSPHNINKGIMLSCFRDMIFTGKTIFLRKNHIPQPSFLLYRYCAVESQIGHPRISADPCFISFSPFSPFAMQSHSCCLPTGSVIVMQRSYSGVVTEGSSTAPVSSL